MKINLTGTLAEVKTHANFKNVVLLKIASNKKVKDKEIVEWRNVWIKDDKHDLIKPKEKSLISIEGYAQVKDHQFETKDGKIYIKEESLYGNTISFYDKTTKKFVKLF